ncbi:bifunctional 3-demethylubiquinone-9 3-methyltransferase/ 2-octaprenyl-6-hydroxy phenol methylase (plasmid) [Legionella adelaidensis]|uniref:Bifunctional 3-demethylubiquinone-9 3-methyltransferase/ 2-octaprenyl-6-hydroxy phenol methylase n=1 Tax=Legionella adelaidensis TaxID=45056 RepID=A0A0W0R1X0_9GAMM|nr:class I SAM-dependent methyltransferase [Legionella adelaidensis]KTC65063.1 bifunctional 3-demethylubiquinone-9 3-methyltransferase/ 2-octaprenyl-6-hydroxy phenol methylase [Legionella adelaidensis]VEH85417.1 bifunctional 3-demethylubiquinone-9 3-methyltransferase/ 2-octaprenyl-6-hydroxy phenol methylase [Legionella adelaidensis]
MPAKINSASAYFNENWQRYQRTIKNNTLYHHEMMGCFESFLKNNFNKEESIDFIDVGCGDASTIAPVLKKFPIKNYIGIDAAKDVLTLAKKNLSKLKGKKKFIAENMLSALKKIHSEVDVIFSSYAVHHLSITDKILFINACKNKLKPGGYLLLIDGVRKPMQTREEWLNDLEKRMLDTLPDSSEEIKIRMEHPRQDDFPETVATFKEIALEQGWKEFRVLEDQGIFVFMEFAK